MYVKVDDWGDETPQYSLKEKIAYHRGIANAGKVIDRKTGVERPASHTEIVNHALAANRAQRKLNRYMQTVKFLNNQGAIKQGYKPKTK